MQLTRKAVHELTVQARGHLHEEFVDARAVSLGGRQGDGARRGVQEGSQLSLQDGTGQGPHLVGTGTTHTHSLRWHVV